ncbi:uncharacterized protein LOC122724384 [Manihot esculenta]|uniref:uncharacterized protein LOC122724384 n=1 Tax=Manihot esculenta TaxID=3983 RepID=UPI001CC7A1AB|nr:uncharacterized protein LOC122724384 [Manihot esculenta]
MTFLQARRKEAVNRAQPAHLLRGFQNVVAEAGLFDFKMDGYGFTWEHGRESGNLIEEKLAFLSPNYGGDLITDYWLSSMGVDLVSRLSDCGDILSVWGKELQQLHKAEMVQCLATMGNFRDSRDAGDMLSFLAAKNQFHELLSLRELYWKQRAKEFWLVNVDRNTHFFHRAASISNKKNRIGSLQNDHGSGALGIRVYKR